MSRPARLLAATRELVVGDLVSPLDLGDLLADGGFAPADPVDQHGQFCIRGGVIDCFPAGESYPLRVEFVGDMIESLRRYDPGTQRSMALLDRATVFPLRDTFEDDGGPAGGAEPARDRSGRASSTTCWERPQGSSSRRRRPAAAGRRASWSSSNAVIAPRSRMMLPWRRRRPWC